MTVFRRHGKWVAEVATGDYTPNGKPRRTRRVADTKAAAERLERELLAQRDRNIPIPRADLTVKEFLKQWIIHVRNANLAPRTIESYTQITKDHLQPHIGRHRLVDLHQSHVNRLKVQLADKGLSANTQRLVRRTLGVALNYAMKNDLVSRNVVTLSNPIPVPRRRALRIRPDQLHEVLRAIQGSPYHDLIATYIYTGMRRGEVIGLKWSDLHLDHEPAWLECSRSYTANAGTFEIRTTKTESSKRIVAIPADLQHIFLERRKALVNDYGYTEEQLEHAYVFARIDDTLPRPDTITKQVRSVCHRAGIPGIGPHQFRHLFATMVQSQGVNTPAISSHLGHSDISTTINIYTHRTPGGVSHVGQAFQAALDDA